MGYVDTYIDTLQKRQPSQERHDFLFRIAKMFFGKIPQNQARFNKLLTPEGGRKVYEKKVRFINSSGFKRHIRTMIATSDDKKEWTPAELNREMARKLPKIKRNFLRALKEKYRKKGVKV